MKNKFEIFNNIKVNIDEYEEIKFSDNDDFKDKMKNRIRGSHNQHKKKIAAVGASVLLGTMVITSEPSLAYIKNIGQQIEHFFNRQDDALMGYKVKVNKVVEDKGVEIELKEIMLGDGELLLSLKVDDSNVDKSYFGIEDDVDTYPDIYQPKVQIGDMIFARTGGGATIEPGDETSKNMLLTCDLNQLESDNEVSKNSEFDLISNLDINKDYDVKIEIDKVGYTIEVDDSKVYNQKAVPDYIEITEVNGGGMNADTGETFETRQGNIIGSWVFETKINAKKLVEDIKIYNINEKFTINYENMDVDVLVEEVRVSPTKIKVKYDLDVEGEVIRGENEDPIIFGFIAKDENGDKVELIGGMDIRFEEQFENNNPHGNYAEGELSSEIKSIKIIPTIEDYSKHYNSTKIFEDKAFNLE